MRTLFLNPPLFGNPAGVYEGKSFLYPVKLCYAAGMLPDSRVVDAPSHNISVMQILDTAKDFELAVLSTSALGLCVDLKLAEMMKVANAKLKVGFVGAPVAVEPGKVLENDAVDFVVRGEFDAQVAGYANGKPLDELPGVSFRDNDRIVHNPECQAIEIPNKLAWVTKVYQRDLDIARYRVPFLQHPYLSLNMRNRRELRSTDDVFAEVRYAMSVFPETPEIFFNDDNFNCRKSRTVELCAKFEGLMFTWSCRSAVTSDYETLKAMKESGCRLLVVEYPSGGAFEAALQFTRNCDRLGLAIHGIFTVGIPDETPEAFRKTLDSAKRLDTETVEVSIADAEHVDAVDRFYDEYYSRSRAAFRVVRKTIARKLNTVGLSQAPTKVVHHGSSTM